jgi:hypothetical protein
MFRRRSVAKGLAAGAIGGLAGTIVMTQFRNAWQKAAQKTNNQLAEEDVSEPRDMSDESREMQQERKVPLVREAPKSIRFARKSLRKRTMAMPPPR